MVDDVESLSLVRECRELEERYKTNFTSAILSATDQDGLDIIRTAQKSINKIDQSLLLQKISKYPSLHKIAECIGLGQCTRPWSPSHQEYEEPCESDHLPRTLIQKMPPV